MGYGLDRTPNIGLTYGPDAERNANWTRIDAAIAEINARLAAAAIPLTSGETPKKPGDASA